jgi:hypothetical protein
MFSIDYSTNQYFAVLDVLTFLPRTILITVLTNSFMAIASNATEEHQYASTTLTTYN